MTEPSSTGIGGDLFCLFYNAESKKVHALNGSGRSGGKITLNSIRKDLGFKDGEAGSIPTASVHAATIPGAAAGWVDTVQKFGSGKLSMQQILAPAIEMGEEGFPVSEISGYYVCSPGCKSCMDERLIMSTVEPKRAITSSRLTELRRNA